MAFARLKVSSHRLEIESGRWNRTPIENRKCQMCNCLEDEYHFILECTMYSDIRNIYIRNYYRCRPTMIKFIELIKSENRNIVRNIGIYIYKAFKNDMYRAAF